MVWKVIGVMMNKHKDSLGYLEEEDRRFNDVKSRPNRVKQPYKRDRKKVDYYEDDTSEDSSEAPS